MKSKMEFHKRDLEQMIALLNTHIKPNLTIIDGIYALEHGPSTLGKAHRADTLVTLLNHAVGKRSAKKILMARLLKNMAFKLGIYSEDFPSFKRYDYPDFDANHF